MLFQFQSWHQCFQVLDALQFLHHRGVVHLNIQPDNVIMQSRRRYDIKLVDFGQAHKITTMDGDPVDRVGTAEFMGVFESRLVTNYDNVIPNTSLLIIILTNYLICCNDKQS